MKVLLLGSGGREHALALAMVKDPQLSELIIAPGNPGTAALGLNVPVDACDGSAVVDLAKKHGVDLVVIGPEAPLVLGVADLLRAEGFAVFGPGRKAAALEGSKAFAKEIMAAAGVPTAKSVAAWTQQEAFDALDRFGAPYVVKQDGLAGGKGVVVTEDLQEAKAHVMACFQAHNAGGGSGQDPALIVEEYLDGPEVSLFCVSDGKNVVPLPEAQDYKRAFDQGKGLNTGGMGAYTPLPWAPADLSARVVREVAQPVIREMAERKMDFVGLLYCGLALTSRGLRVVEFNARFGDPETQSVLERVESSVLQLLWAAAIGDLSQAEPLRVSTESCINVVLAAPGYPGKVQTGGVLHGLEEAEAQSGVHIVHAGTCLDDQGRLVASGGRVLSVVGKADSLEQARQRAYRAMSMISLEGGHYRKDIAHL